MWTNSYSLEDLGEFVAEVRKDRGITQVELARLTGMSHATLSALENGRAVSSDKIERALQMLGMRVVIIPKAASVEVRDEGA